MYVVYKIVLIVPKEVRKHLILPWIDIIRKDHTPPLLLQSETDKTDSRKIF